MTKKKGGNKTIYLVSCVSQKKAKAAEAKDLYISDLFRKARRYVETTGCPWFILSAEYGLVPPEKVIAPYENTLNRMPAARRRRWAQQVIDAIEPHLSKVDHVVFLAGRRYREFLIDYLQDRGIVIEVPMERLRFGEQKKWLQEQSQ
jgi:cytoplasmic iron level regulating protein YaaA (DUF328/UPF0246 family)